MIRGSMASYQDRVNVTDQGDLSLMGLDPFIRYGAVALLTWDNCIAPHTEKFSGDAVSRLAKNPSSMFSILSARGKSSVK
jgi:hypothetical protein